MTGASPGFHYPPSSGLCFPSVSPSIGQLSLFLPPPRPLPPSTWRAPDWISVIRPVATPLSTHLSVQVEAFGSPRGGRTLLRVIRRGFSGCSGCGVSAATPHASCMLFLWVNCKRGNLDETNQSKTKVAPKIQALPPVGGLNKTKDNHNIISAFQPGLCFLPPLGGVLLPAADARRGSRQ